MVASPWGSTKGGGNAFPRPSAQVRSTAGLPRGLRLQQPAGGTSLAAARAFRPATPKGLLLRATLTRLGRRRRGGRSLLGLLLGRLLPRAAAAHAALLSAPRCCGVGVAMATAPY